jgi:hypothetical protein
MSPGTAATDQALEQQVRDLLARWREETAHQSSSSQLTAHPAYAALIALGEPAVPFLLRDLAQTYDGHLSKALTAITGAKPMPPEHRGQIRQVAEDWLRWARENGRGC